MAKEKPFVAKSTGKTKKVEEEVVTKAKSFDVGDEVYNSDFGVGTVVRCCTRSIKLEVNFGGSLRKVDAETLGKANNDADGSADGE